MNPRRSAVSVSPIMRVLAALLGLLAAVLVVASFQGKFAAAATTCAGKQVAPSQDLSAVAAASPAGTTFCLKDGSFYVSAPIRVQDRDSFVGVYTDGTRPNVWTKEARHVFYTAGADDVAIRDLVVSGAKGDDSCEPECGRGIGGGGTNLRVHNVRAAYNANQGIGGTGPNLLVTDSYFDHNGSEDFAMDGGKVSAAGIKSLRQ